MKRALLPGFVALAFALTAALTASGARVTAAQTSDASASVGGQLERGLDAIRAAHQVPGVSLSVLLPGARLPLTVAGGTMEVGADVPVTATSMFPIGGITTTMTAALLLLVAADGKLSLDDPLAKYFPEFPAWAGVTVRQLLDMTSGIVDYTAGDSPSPAATDPGRRWTLHQLADLAYESTPNTSFAPGQGWEYSATNAVLAGMLVERVTGHPFAGELRRRVLGTRGAGLPGTYYGSVLPPWVRVRLVDGSDDGSGLAAGGTSGTAVAGVNLTWAGPAGAAVSDTPDLARWTRASFSGGMLPEGARHELNQFVAAPSDVTDPGAGAPTDTTDPNGYSLGWNHGYQQAIGPFWFEFGAATDDRSWTAWLPCSNLSVAIAMNQRGAESAAIDALRDMALDTVLHSPEFGTALAAHPAPYLRTCPG